MRRLCWFLPLTLLVGCSLWRPTALRDELLKQENQSHVDGYSRTDPGPVLRLVPIGTPVEKARSVMKENGFDTSLENGVRPFLACRAVRSRLLMADAVEVHLYYKDGKVTEVEVVATCGECL